jgi:hypothetical protein
MNDMEELDDEKLDEFLKLVKKWDAKQPKSLHDYLKAARTSAQRNWSALEERTLLIPGTTTFCWQMR